MSAEVAACAAMLSDRGAPAGACMGALGIVPRTLVSSKWCDTSQTTSSNFVVLAVQRSLSFLEHATSFPHRVKHLSVFLGLHVLPSRLRLSISVSTGHVTVNVVPNVSSVNEGGLE